MPALESRQGDAYSDIALGGRLLILVLERDLDVDCTSATYEELPLVLAIEVDEDLPLGEAGLQAMRPDHTDLLIDGEEGLDRAMAERVIREDGQHIGCPDTIVRAEGRIACRDPLAVDIGVYGVGDEVVLHVAILLWHHVEVRL